MMKASAFCEKNNISMSSCYRTIKFLRTIKSPLVKHLIKKNNTLFLDDELQQYILSCRHRKKRAVEWCAVTNDDEELFIASAESAEGLAHKLGVTRQKIYYQSQITSRKNGTDFFVILRLRDAGFEGNKDTGGI